MPAVVLHCHGAPHQASLLLLHKQRGHSLQVSKANRALESEVRGSAPPPDGLGVKMNGPHEQLLTDPAMCEQFVGLLCQFEPSAVLPFLQSHDTYRCASQPLLTPLSPYPNGLTCP